jgi:hypothetical protein
MKYFFINTVFSSIYDVHEGDCFNEHWAFSSSESDFSLYHPVTALENPTDFMQIIYSFICREELNVDSYGLHNLPILCMISY